MFSHQLEKLFLYTYLKPFWALHIIKLSNVLETTDLLGSDKRDYQLRKRTTGFAARTVMVTFANRKRQVRLS